MAHVYFHCSNTEVALIDRCGTCVSDLTEAHDHAARVVRALTMTPGDDDWRDWLLHVSDDLGGEIFVMPFASLLGQPH